MGLSIFSIIEVISFLKNNDYDKFNFKDELAIIYANDIEILFELCNGSISEELGEIAVSVLGNLENCISKAQIWLEHFNVKKDKAFTNAFDNGFEVSGIYFGKYGVGHQQKPLCEGFTISFNAINYYPCQFTVKFYRNMHPFAVEEWVQ